MMGVGGFLELPNQSYLVKAIREITDTMLVVNASVNFVIYVVFNRGFRDRLVSQLRCRPLATSTPGPVLEQTGGPCRRTDVATNNFEMASPRTVTTSGSRKKKTHRRGFHRLSFQTDL